MSEEIINKVAQSSLQVFDLEEYFPTQPITGVDVSQWLEEGFLLREKEFRVALQEHSWENYNHHLVYIYCSTDAIIPAWATILVASYLNPFAKLVIHGNKKELLVRYYQQEIATINFAKYQDKPSILKGCSKKPVPEEVYVIALHALQKVAKSVMYGEACSAVPIFKRK
ncbi:MAG: DUF2480 family protein [Flavobacterium sp.]